MEFLEANAVESAIQELDPISDDLTYGLYMNFQLLLNKLNISGPI